ncbi:MAG: MFS transporter, partial [Candidatus Dormibacteraeota bacterium]|nr:MFS transporter [Candidatus Dormibacteraeota bacterium]
MLGRVGGSMVTVTLILFVLARYHSPQLAGATAFFSIFPGLVVSPVAGALLDRHGRARLVVLDYLIAAFTVALLGVLSALNALPWAMLLAIVGIASLTNPLSSTGARSLFPVITPPTMWERANALDSSGHVIAQLVGAPVAGVMMGLLGPEWALGSCGVVFVAAALVMLRLPEPTSTSVAQGSIALNAWRGLQYVARNPTLRGLALTLITFNLSWGVLIIAVPVLVLDRLHQGPATVGFLWGAMGAAGLISALVAGRMSSRGRERQLMFGGILVSAGAIAVLPFATALPAVLLVIILFGLANGPLDIALFTLRQRRTDPAWFGRAFAVSMSVNWIGQPIGSALAGPLIGWSLDLAL